MILIINKINIFWRERKTSQFWGVWTAPERTHGYLLNRWARRPKMQKGQPQPKYA
jgi:hypothetical protein